MEDRLIHYKETVVDILHLSHANYFILCIMLLDIEPQFLCKTTSADLSRNTRNPF